MITIYFSNKMEEAVLSFNMTVSNKSIFDDEYIQKEYYQIMPSTQRVLTENAIKNYPKISNPNIIIHMNYTTYVFTEQALEQDSQARISLRRYNELADRLGTKNILIHMPKSKNEIEYIDYGLHIIYEELIKNGKTLQFEITTWTKDLQELFELRSRKIDAVKEYIDLLIDKINKIETFANNYKIVFDTAHLYSLGFDGNDMVTLMKQYINKCQYVHLNGNYNGMYCNDKHSIIFSKNNKFIDTCHVITRYCSDNKLICIMEVTQETCLWKYYKQFADKFKFRLVNESDAFTH